MGNNLSESIQFLKGIGPKKAKAFAKAGISTIEDLLYYFPHRYEDRTSFSTISKLQEGLTITIKAQVLAVGERRSWRRRGFSILEVAVGDATGKIFCVWFNQGYLKEYFRPGTTLILYGKVDRYGSRLQMSAPEFEIVTPIDEALDVGRIVPVYSLPESITQRHFRHLVKSSLDEYLPKLNDFLPYDIRSKNNFYNLAKALLNIHFPESFDIQKQAYERLAFDEFFVFQLPLALRKLKKKEKKGIAHCVVGEVARDYISSLPFKLTSSQEKVIKEIRLDMASPQAMQRLLQGDVGSGKTVVANIAAMMAIQGGYQAAFMVPTEILALQHFEKLNSMGVRTALLTSSVSKKEKDKVLQEIKEGKANFVIGTHALLERGVKFKNLGLVVIDEQHKFGVGQRALLPKKGPNPDVLIMTATPIPRTLAITLYGDLDISVINELPAGRLPVKTIYFSMDKSGDAYEVAREELKKGRQVFIIYPVIEESYALDIAGAKKMYAQLKSGEFKGFNLGLIHGRLKQEEQDDLMHKFKNKDIDLLVSTTVLEVGIDISNATCMIVEHAQRFGLSQLHQLRGRIGRGGAQSYCVLISDAKTAEAEARIGAMLKYSDGFRIAEEDLKIRGPGEFFGRRQHGLTELKIANPLTQMHLLKLAREDVIKLVNADPRLEEKQHLLLKEKMLQRFPEYEKLIMVG
ncbi:MAG: ATP-dependent DNA helicase RecG [Candidatus Omnitrophica bacterium]|nr:ATP-dependent DNA helicase RecG [Candidatus Omnitrophota bacterium]